MNLLPQHNPHLSAERIPSDDEIQAAIKKLNNTAPGPSGIRSSIWKTLAADANAFALLRDFVHDFWNTEVVPSEWDIGQLTILGKKGDRTNPDN